LGKGQTISYEAQYDAMLANSFVNPGGNSGIGRKLPSRRLVLDDFNSAYPRKPSPSSSRIFLSIRF
jgi:hypothetical protein